MTVRFMPIAFAATTLGACANFAPTPDPAPPPPERIYTCNADDLQVLVGEQANDNTGKLALKQSGAKMLRWIPPNSAVTMDFRQDRLNISYDENMRIDRVNCG